MYQLYFGTDSSKVKMCRTQQCTVHRVVQKGSDLVANLYTRKLCVLPWPRRESKHFMILVWNTAKVFFRKFLDFTQGKKV